MSILDKARASAGYGSARVETHIDTQKIYNGEQITGFISIAGGKAEQKASNVSLVLMAYIDSDDEVRKELKLAEFDILQDIIIKPNATIKLPFSIVLPNDTPVSIQVDIIWIETNLDIKMAVDPSNKSYIKVMPHPFMQRIFDILQNDLKFILTKYENKYIPNNGCHLPIAQSFEFYSLSHLIEHHDELKMIFFVDDLRGLEILLESPVNKIDAHEFVPEVRSAKENMIRIFIPKKEFEKNDKSLADLLLQNIRSHIV